MINEAIDKKRKPCLFILRHKKMDYSVRSPFNWFPYKKVRAENHVSAPTTVLLWVAKQRQQQNDQWE